MEIYGSRYVKIRITTATEDHHGVGRLTRVRVKPMMSNFCKVLTVASTILTGLLLLQDYLWPFSRTAVLIPVTWWTMYLINRWRVTTPVLGMIDEIAEGAGYWPVPAKRNAKAVKVVEPLPRPVADQGLREDLDVEEHALA